MAVCISFVSGYQQLPLSMNGMTLAARQSIVDPFDRDAGPGRFHVPNVGRHGKKNVYICPVLLPPLAERLHADPLFVKHELVGVDWPPPPAPAVPASTPAPAVPASTPAPAAPAPPATTAADASTTPADASTTTAADAAPADGELPRALRGFPDKHRMIRFNDQFVTVCFRYEDVVAPNWRPIVHYLQTFVAKQAEEAIELRQHVFIALDLLLEVCIRPDAGSARVLYPSDQKAPPQQRSFQMLLDYAYGIADHSVSKRPQCVPAATHSTLVRLFNRRQVHTLHKGCVPAHKADLLKGFNTAIERDETTLLEFFASFCKDKLAEQKLRACFDWHSRGGSKHSSPDTKPAPKPPAFNVLRAKDVKRRAASLFERLCSLKNLEWQKKNHADTPSMPDPLLVAVTLLQDCVTLSDSCATFVRDRKTRIIKPFAHTLPHKGQLGPGAVYISSALVGDAFLASFLSQPRLPKDVARPTLVPGAGMRSLIDCSMNSVVSKALGRLGDNAFLAGTCQLTSCEIHLQVRLIAALEKPISPAPASLHQRISVLEQRVMPVTQGGAAPAEVAPPDIGWPDRLLRIERAQDSLLKREGMLDGPVAKDTQDTLRTLGTLEDALELKSGSSMSSLHNRVVVAEVRSNTNSGHHLPSVSSRLLWVEEQLLVDLPDAVKILFRSLAELEHDVCMRLPLAAVAKRLNWAAAALEIPGYVTDSNVGAYVSVRVSAVEECLRSLGFAVDAGVSADMLFVERVVQLANMLRIRDGVPPVASAVPAAPLDGCVGHGAR